jgi:3-phosphoshikimate 1-carboxyvinyltransferase
LGANIHYAGKEGFAPLQISPSKIKGGKLSIPAGISSQFISSLLLCAPYFEQGLELELTGEPVSYSYILLTAQVMKYFGAEININGNFIDVRAQPYRPADYTIEGDWSSASYFYALAALSEQCEIQLNGLNPQSLQGDRTITAMAAVFGVETQVDGENMVLHKKKIHLPLSVQENFLLCPDITQTMAAICAGQKIPQVVFNGLSTLSGKETDRIRALEQELTPFGILFRSSEKGALAFDGSSFSASPRPVKTYHDHRMAMSFAPLAQKTGTLVIEDAQVVQKSYPRYWEDLKTLGCLVENSDI